MSSVNKVILLGNLGSDPEVRYTKSGDAVVNLSVATSEQWKDKATGQMKENTEWHRVGIFGKPAEVAAQYLRKGSKIYVEGRIRYKKYAGKDGTEQFSVEILSDTFKMLGKPGNDKESEPISKPAKVERNEMDDEIPF
jgi:single-strand DNA-binding protein